MLILWIFAGAVLLFLFQRGLYRQCWMRRLSVRIRFDVPVVEAGEPVTVIERVENRKLLPLPVFSYEYVLSRNFLVLKETGGRQQRIVVKVALPARRAVRNRTRIEGLPRGIYALGDVTLHGYDLFYSFHDTVVVPSYAQLTVYPQKIPAEKLTVPFRSMLGTVLTRRLSLEDPFQLRGIRQYEIYDSMRDINWKASARTGELKVNQHEYTTDEALLLLLDLGGGTEAQRETVLSLASTLSSMFLRRGVSVSLQANGRSCVSSKQVLVRAGSGAGHLSVIDESLAQIKLTATVTKPFDAFLRELTPRELSESLPVVISADGEGIALQAFREVLGEQRGYYFSVTEHMQMQTDRIRVFNWDDTLQEVRL